MEANVGMTEELHVALVDVDEVQKIDPRVATLRVTSFVGSVVEITWVNNDGSVVRVQRVSAT